MTIFFSLIFTTIVKKLTAENIALQSTIHDLETKRKQMETEIKHLQETISNLSSHYCQTFDKELSISITPLTLAVFGRCYIFHIFTKLSK